MSSRLGKSKVKIALRGQGQALGSLGNRRSKRQLREPGDEGVAEEVMERILREEGRLVYLHQMQATLDKQSLPATLRGATVVVAEDSQDSSQSAERAGRQDKRARFAAGEAHAKGGERGAGGGRGARLGGSPGQLQHQGSQTSQQAALHQNDGSYQSSGGTQGARAQVRQDGSQQALDYSYERTHGVRLRMKRRSQLVRATQDPHLSPPSPIQTVGQGRAFRQLLVAGRAPEETGSVGLTEAAIREEESGTENLEEHSRAGPVTDSGPVPGHPAGVGPPLETPDFDRFALFDRTRFGGAAGKKKEGASPGFQCAYAAELPVEAQVHAALRSQESSSNFHRALRRHNNTTEYYESYLSGSGKKDRSLTKAGRTRMYYHNNDLSNRQLQLVNVQTAFVEAGLLQAGGPLDREGDAPAMRWSREPQEELRACQERHWQPCQPRSQALSPQPQIWTSGVGELSPRRVSGSNEPRPSAYEQFLLAGGRQAGSPWSRADSKPSLSDASGTQEAARSSRSSLPGPPQLHRELFPYAKLGETQPGGASDPESLQYEDKGSTPLVGVQEPSASPRELIPHMQNLNQLLLRSLHARRSKDKPPKSAEPDDPQGGPASPSPEAVEPPPSKDAAAGPTQKKKLGQEARTQVGASSGVAFPGSGRDSDPKLKYRAKVLPRIMVTLPKGSITCKAGQAYIASTKKGKERQKNPVAAGGRRLPSFSRTLGGLSPAMSPGLSSPAASGQAVNLNAQVRPANEETYGIRVEGLGDGRDQGHGRQSGGRLAASEARSSALRRGAKRPVSIFEQPVSCEEPSDAEESSVGGFGQRRRRAHPASLPPSQLHMNKHPQPQQINTPYVLDVPGAERLDAERQDQVRELADLHGRLLERLDDIGRPGAAGSTHTSLGPATHNLERQSVLQHYAPRRSSALGGWPGPLVHEQMSSQNQKSPNLDAGDQHWALSSRLVGHLVPADPDSRSGQRYNSRKAIAKLTDRLATFSTTREFSGAQSPDGRWVDVGASESQPPNPSRAIAHNQSAQAPKNFLNADQTARSPLALHIDPPKSGELITFSSTRAGPATKLKWFTSTHGPTGQDTNQSSPTTSVLDGAQKFKDSRTAVKLDGNQKMTQTMQAFGPASRNAGATNCMQNLAFVAGNFNPGLTARMPDAVNLQKNKQIGIGNAQIKTQANFDFQTILGQPQPQEDAAQKRRVDFRNSDWTLSTRTDLPALQQNSSPHRILDVQSIKRKRYSHLLPEVQPEATMDGQAAAAAHPSPLR